MTEDKVKPHRPIDRRQERMLAEATEALERIADHKRMAWADWLRVGDGLAVGRTLALLWSNSNTPTGRRYAETFAAFMAERRLCEPLINKDDRAALLHIMDRKAEVLAWRAKLPDSEQYGLNNPRVVWNRFKRHAQQAERFANPDQPPNGKNPESTATLRERAVLANDDARLARQRLRDLRVELARARAEINVRTQVMSKLFDHLHEQGGPVPIGEDEARTLIETARRDVPDENEEVSALDRELS